MKDDIGQRDRDKGTADYNPKPRCSEGIEKHHEAEGYEQKTDLGQKRRVQKKGDDGDKNMTPFQPSPGIGQYSLPAFAQYAIDDQEDGKYSEN